MPIPFAEVCVAIPREVHAAIDQLAPLPVTANRLFEALSGEDVSLVRVADLLEHDQVIAARVLKMARSSVYAGRMPVADVRDAVVRLGAGTVLELILGDYLKTIRVNAPLYSMAEEELWAHGAAAGLAVRALAQECPKAEIPHLARTAALVHDIGKLLMVRAVKAEPAAVLALCHAEGITWVEAERQIFGFDHAEAGAALARAWSFPDPIIEAIEHHHDSPIASPTIYTDTVVAANLVAKSIGVGLGAEGMNFNVDPGLSHRLGLSFSGFSRVCIQTATWLKEVRGVSKAA